MYATISPESLAALRTLVAAVESGSLTGAARRLGLTPSAVSRQVSRLEEAVGARLLERTTRSLRATDAGLELCRKAGPLFEAFAEAFAGVAERRGTVDGRVRLSTTPALGRSRVVPVLARLAAEHPALDFDVVLTGRRLDFFEDEIDLAVREGPLDDSSLVSRRLGASDVVLCASPAYLGRRGEPEGAGALRGHDLLVVPGAAAERALSSLRAHGAEAVRPRFRVDDLFALRDLAERGAGIAALPDYLVGEAFEAGRLRRVLADVPVARLEIHAVVPSRRHLPRRVSVVIDALGEALRGPWQA